MAEKSYYTCSPYTSAELLRTSGEEPVELVISYVYELDTPSTTTATQTTTEEGGDLLTSAMQHVEQTILKRMATITNLINCDNEYPFRRRLKFQGRGSTSIIAMSSDYPTFQSCESLQEQQFDTVGEATEIEAYNEGVTEDLSGSAVIVGINDSRQEEQGGADGAVLAATRVDGVIDPASVIRSGGSLAEKKEVKEEEGGAYNYWSTQSDVWEFDSGYSSEGVSLSQSSVTMMTMDPHKRSGEREGMSCNVIRGQMTLFLNKYYDPYENLDGRMLETIKTDLNDEGVLQKEFLNDSVLGIRLLEPAMDTTMSTSTSSTASSINTNYNAVGTDFASSNIATGLVAGLGAIFLMLIGLFAYSSRPRKRRRLEEDDSHLSSCHSYDNKYEDELAAVSAVFSGKKQDENWWHQEQFRGVIKDASHSPKAETPIPAVEASFSSEGVLSVIVSESKPISIFGGVIVGDDDDDAISEKKKSPKRLPLAIFRKDKSRDEEDLAVILVNGELMKSDGEQAVDTDDFLLNSVEESKPRKPKRRMFGRKRSVGSDMLIDDDIIIEETAKAMRDNSRLDSCGVGEVIIEENDSPDAFGIETTRTAPLRPMSAYASPTVLRSTRARKTKSFPEEQDCDRAVRNCQSDALSCLPLPEIGGDEDSISVLTENNFSQFSRGPPCVQPSGDQLMLVKGAVSQCFAPTENDSVGTSQLARRQPQSNTLDAFTECWNPFEGNFWQGWFD